MPQTQFNPDAPYQAAPAAFDPSAAYEAGADETPAPVEDKGAIAKAWDWANQGLISGDQLLNIVAKGMPRPDDMKPNETTAQYLRRNRGYINPDHPYVAGIRAGLAGAVGDIYNVASSFTSPLSIVLMGAGAAGKAVPAGSRAYKAIKAAQGAAGAAIGAQGAGEVGEAVNDDGAPLPDRIQRGLMGASMMAGGGAGVLDAVPEVIPPIPRSVKTAPVRAAARATEKALSPINTIAKLFTPADEAAAGVKIPGRDLGLEPDPVYPGAFLPEDPGVFPGAPYPEHPGVFPGAEFPANPTPEQLNPALVSPSRSLPGQIPPELTPGGLALVRRAESAPEPFPKREGLSLPPAPEPDYASMWGKTKSVGGNQSTEFAQLKAEMFPGVRDLSNEQIEAINDRMNAPEPAAAEAEPERSVNLDFPRTLSGESAMRRILTGQDNANLMKIAKARGLNVTREAQLRPGFADNLLINKIINDYSPDELNGIRDQFLEVGRNRHQFGDIGPEGWKHLNMETYFPEVKTPLMQQLRGRQAIERNMFPAAEGEPAAPAAERPNLMSELRKEAKTKKPAEAAPSAVDIAEVPPSTEPTASGDNLEELLQQSLEELKARKKQLKKAKKDLRTK